jgi:hypothetical protein
VPIALQWIQEVSMIKYAFEALCINEFEGLKFEMDRAPFAASIATGEQVIIQGRKEKWTDGRG